jgi:hypothetical protein
LVKALQQEAREATGHGGTTPALFRANPGLAWAEEDLRDLPGSVKARPHALNMGRRTEGEEEEEEEETSL